MGEATKKARKQLNLDISSREDLKKCTISDDSKKKNIFSQQKSDNQALEKVTDHFGNFKTSLNKLKHSFRSYKVSNFFCPASSDFCKNFADILQQSEDKINEMGEILSQFYPNPAHAAVSEDESPINVDKTYALQEKKSDPGTLTPPASEIGIDEGVEYINLINSKKRKSKQDDEKVVKRSNRFSRSGSQVCVDVLPPAQVVVSPKKGNDSEEEKPPDEYEVESIKDYVKKQGRYCYHVSWKGYTSEDDTFEPLQHLTECDQLLINFFTLRLKARFKAASPSELRELPIPYDADVGDFLYKSLHEIVLPPDPDKLSDSIKLLNSKSFTVKSVEEIKESILRLLAFKDPTHDKYKNLLSSVQKQIICQDIKQHREKQLAELRAWERRMNIICSDPSPLSVENNVDLCLPPKDFIYINDYLEGSGIKIPTEPMIGCKCDECSIGCKSCCPQNMDSYFAYTKYGKLRVSLATPIYECNKECKCGTQCANRVVQKGRLYPLAIFRTENGRGWGVKALESIKKGSFVTEYVGEVISSEEAERRGMKYDAEGCTYLFDLDYNKGDLNPYTVDAAKYGNVSHFINHSCDPNLAVYNVWVNCLDPDLPKLALFAVDDIKKGEELTFDYNSGSTRQNPSSQIIEINSDDESCDSLLRTPTKFDLAFSPADPMRKTPKTRGKTACQCGAANCRRYFF